MRNRQFADLRTTGLLWLINASVLHPRGYALALHFDDDGTCTGWSLLGDGSEPWHFNDQPDADGWSPDQALRAVNKLMPQDDEPVDPRPGATQPVHKPANIPQLSGTRSAQAAGASASGGR